MFYSVLAQACVFLRCRRLEIVKSKRASTSARECPAQVNVKANTDRRRDWPAFKLSKARALARPYLPLDLHFLPPPTTNANRLTPPSHSTTTPCKTICCSAPLSTALKIGCTPAAFLPVAVCIALWPLHGAPAAANSRSSVEALAFMHPLRAPSWKCYTSAPSRVFLWMLVHPGSSHKVERDQLEPSSSTLAAFVAAPNDPCSQMSADVVLWSSLPATDASLSGHGFWLVLYAWMRRSSPSPRAPPIKTSRLASDFDHRPALHPWNENPNPKDNTTDQTYDSEDHDRPSTLPSERTTEQYCYRATFAPRHHHTNTI